MKHIYNVQPGDVYWAASDIGWVVGHSYIVYAPLLYGCTTILYEGKPVGTPDAGAFWRVIEQHKVNCLFTAPMNVATPILCIGLKTSSMFRSLIIGGKRKAAGQWLPTRWVWNPWKSNPAHRR